MRNILIDHGIGQAPIRSTAPLTITPGTADIVKQAGWYLKDITVKGDPDLISANIVKDKNIFDVVGTARRVATGTHAGPVYPNESSTITLGWQPRYAAVLYDCAANSPSNGLVIITDFQLNVQGSSGMNGVSLTRTSTGFTIAVASIVPGGITNMQWYAAE